MAEKAPYSRPVFQQSLTINTLQAQRVMDRVFGRVSYALYSIDVILQIIGDQDEIEQVEDIILDMIDNITKDLDKSTAHFKKKMADNGLDEVPKYSHPKKYDIKIESPQAAKFARLAIKLDTLITYIDTLWMNCYLPNKQRTQIDFEWQQRVIKMGARIINLEKRARASAHNKGKDTEVAKVAPEASAEPLEAGEQNTEATQEPVPAQAEDVKESKAA